MRQEVIRLSDENSNLLSRLSFGSRNISNSRQRDRMQKILCSSIIRELTSLQRYCVMEYYMNNKKQREIANDLGVAPSTVNRHIARGMQKLRNIASYYS